MNIYHLKYFIDAAKLGSVSQSAQLNFVGHSAVSQAIKSLEEQLEVSLIYHSKRRFQLTPEGELFLTEATQMLQQIVEMKERMQSQDKQVRGVLNIWAPQSLIVDSLYETLETYKKLYPQVRINIKPGAAALVRNAISSGEGQIGLAVDDGHLTNFNQKIIKSGEFILINNSKKFDVAQSNVIVTSVEKIEVQHLIKNYKHIYKKDLQINMEVMSWSVIKTLVEKGFGVGYVPDYCVSKELEQNRLHKLSSARLQFKYQIKAIWAKNKQLHKNAELFVSLLKQNCN